MVQTDMNASTAFKYDTGGKDACDFACCVDSVSNDVTPNVTLAGAASGLIQNETHFQRNPCNLSGWRPCFNGMHCFTTLVSNTYGHDNDQTSRNICVK